MTPQTAAFIAMIHLAYAEVERRQAALPPPGSDGERLERLYEIDQAGRNAMQTVDLSDLPEAEQDIAIKAIAAEIDSHDLANQKALKKMLPKSGWFRRSLIGDKAEEAAFMIVQHSVNDPALMHATLPKIEEAVKRGEADGNHYALLYDRIALEFDHKPQRYGSQLECRDGKWTPLDLEAPDQLDQRRAALGLPPEADYLKGFETSPCESSTPASKSAPVP